MDQSEIQNQSSHIYVIFKLHRAQSPPQLVIHQKCKFCNQLIIQVT